MTKETKRELGWRMAGDDEEAGTLSLSFNHWGYSSSTDRVYGFDGSESKIEKVNKMSLRLHDYADSGSIYIKYTGIKKRFKVPEKKTTTIGSIEFEKNEGFRKLMEKYGSGADIIEAFLVDTGMKDFMNSKENGSMDVPDTLPAMDWKG